MQVKDIVRIGHMVDAAETALTFIEGRRRADLETDTMLRFAVVRAIEIVGEAAAHVSVEGRAEASAVPWKQIVGMRNRVVHRYIDIDNDGRLGDAQHRTAGIAAAAAGTAVEPLTPNPGRRNSHTMRFSNQGFDTSAMAGSFQGCGFPCLALVSAAEPATRKNPGFVLPCCPTRR